MRFRLLFLWSIITLLPFGWGWAQSDDQPVYLRAEPAYFSPNGDELQDQGFLYPVLDFQSDVSRWRLEIEDESGRLIQRQDGGTLSALLKWDGRNRRGNIVPEGTYDAQLLVWGPSGRVRSPRENIYVDTTPPLVDLSLSTAVLGNAVLLDQEIIFSPSVEDASPIDHWQIQVLNLTGRTVFTHWSTGPVSELSWDGKDSQTGVLVSLGSYRCAFQAWDAAGNASETVFKDLQVDVSARDMLTTVLKTLTIHETPEGLIVQLRGRDLFEPSARQPTLRPQADAKLREVAILANAYSDVPVYLDGYSWRKGFTLTQDRDQSSLAAWAVYSHLAKKGNVKASRILVKGRGRSATFERRAINLPVLKDGVEIFLRGNQW